MAPKQKITKKPISRKNTQSSSQFSPFQAPQQTSRQPQTQPFQQNQQQRLPTQVEMGRFTYDENALDYGNQYGFSSSSHHMNTWPAGTWKLFLLGNEISRPEMDGNATFSNFFRNFSF